MVIQIKLHVRNVFGILKTEVDTRTDCPNGIFVKFSDIVSEVVATDPHFSKAIFSLQHFLPFVIKSSKEHKNYKFERVIFLITKIKVCSSMWIILFKWCEKSICLKIILFFIFTQIYDWYMFLEYELQTYKEFHS